MSRCRTCAGQASVEAVATMPLLLLVVVALLWGAAAGVVWLSGGVAAWRAAREAAVDPAPPAVPATGVFRLQRLPSSQGVVRVAGTARLVAPWGPPVRVDVSAEAAGR